MIVAPQTRVITRGASVAGVAHLRAGLPCQDRFAVHVHPDGTVVIAVADGLGSASRSHDGADTAVRVAVTAIDPMNGLERARIAVDAYAAMHELEIRSLACTLSVTVWRDGTAQTAHIGDGGVVVQRGDGLLQCLSGPGDSEYVEETDPLTMEGWRARVRVSDVVDDVTAIAAFTDGVQRAAMRPDGAPSDGFFSPLFGWAGEPASEEGELAGLLGGVKLSEHSDDDKTLVLAVLGA